MDEILNIFEADHGHETGSALIYMYALKVMFVFNDAFGLNLIDFKFIAH